MKRSSISAEAHRQVEIVADRSENGSMEEVRGKSQVISIQALNHASSDKAHRDAPCEHITQVEDTVVRGRNREHIAQEGEEHEGTETEAHQRQAIRVHEAQLEDNLLLILVSHRLKK